MKNGKAAGMLDTSRAASKSQCTDSLPAAEHSSKHPPRRALSRAQIDDLIARAATFASLHARQPLFQKRMLVQPGVYVVVRLGWPGVLQVLDPATGAVICESVPVFEQQADDGNDD